jgi:hypothetical protein
VQQPNKWIPYGFSFHQEGSCPLAGARQNWFEGYRNKIGLDPVTPVIDGINFVTATINFDASYFPAFVAKLFLERIL